MVETPMKPEELSLAKDSQSRSLPGMFESSSRAAGALAQISLYNLPRDYFEKLPGRLNVGLGGRCGNGRPGISSPRPDDFDLRG